MRKLFFVPLLVLASTSTISAQSVEAVLDKYLHAVGMTEPGGIQSMYISMELSTQGQVMPMEMYLERPDKVNITIAMMGQEMIMNKNGAETWMINPMAGSSEPVPLPDGQDASLSDAMNNIDGKFVSYKDNPDDYEYLGTEEFDGKEYSKVKAMIEQSGEKIETINYFDNESHLLVKQSMDIMGQSAENTFEDYQEVAGYSLPFTTITTVGGSEMNKMTMLKVEINRNIDDNIFAKP